MSSVLYVTTFNKKLYDAVGQHLLRSFSAFMSDFHLAVCYEDDIHKDITRYPIKTLHLLDLGQDAFLHKWLEDNKDIIPIKYGGEFTGCNCHKIPTSQHYYKGHIRQCPGLGFNMRAACWFRKIAALNFAKNLDYSILFFLDSDTIIKKPIADSYVEGILGDSNMFYQLGMHRNRLGTGIESGLIGWRKEGYFFIDKLINCFLSKEFRKYDRWDDGYIIRKILEETPEINAVDIVGPHMLQPFSHVTRYSKFANYIEHDKGSTTKKHKIFSDSTAL